MKNWLFDVVGSLDLGVKVPLLNFGYSVILCFWSNDSNSEMKTVGKLGDYFSVLRRVYLSIFFCDFLFLWGTCTDYLNLPDSDLFVNVMFRIVNYSFNIFSGVCLYLSELSNKHSHLLRFKSVDFQENWV